MKTVKELQDVEEGVLEVSPATLPVLKGSVNWDWYQFWY